MHRADNRTTFMCRMSINLEVSVSWNHQDLSRPAHRLLSLYLYWAKFLYNLLFSLTLRSSIFSSKLCFPMYAAFRACLVRVTARAYVFWVYVYVRPASWSSDQSFWLLTTRSRVRFPALPWGFSLWKEDPRGDHGLDS